MILLTYKSADSIKLGVKTAGGVLDVQAAAQALNIRDMPITPNAFFTTGLAALPALKEMVSKAKHPLLDESTVELAPCVPQPGKILCVGLNYRKHAAESGMEPPKNPILFSKFNNSLAAHNEPVPLPTNAVQYDYEAELVIVMGKKARYVSVENALDTVLGYCNGNDVSARDLQFLTPQWLLGKTPDKFMPIGPYVVTADEAGDPKNMQVKCWLNGELRQNSNSGDMIFSVAEIVSFASQYMTLEAGDIISTGTPEGVIIGMKDKVWMKPGDESTIEIGNLGRLTNKMSAEQVTA